MLTPTQPRRESEDYGDQILSKAVKAGRRTYFFDVRATRGDDWFLTITESRKITAPDVRLPMTVTRSFCIRRISPNSRKVSEKSLISFAVARVFPIRRNDTPVSPRDRGPFGARAEGPFLWMAQGRPQSHDEAGRRTGPFKLPLFFLSLPRSGHRIRQTRKTVASNDSGPTALGKVHLRMQTTLCNIL